MQNFIIHGFENALWLIIGAIFLVCIIVCLIFKKSQSNFVDEDILLEVYGGNTYWYTTYVFCVICITGIFFIILAGPYNNQQIENIQKDGIDIEIVFDVSHSMIAEDLYPNRLEVAKSVLTDFIGEIQSDRIGLILFAGKAFQSIPLSYDYDFLSSFIYDIEVDTIDQQNQNLQGTAIGDALILASDVLSQGDQNRERIIILITDGTANRGIDPSVAELLLIEKNIKTYSIGVGQKGDTFIDAVVAPGFTQRVPVAGIDEEILKSISTTTGGKYFRADSQGAFKDILSTIGKLEKSQLEIEIISFNNSQKIPFLYLLLLAFTPLGYIVFIKKIQL